jgi:hypothetical protein
LPQPKYHFDNLTGAVKAGLQAAPIGAAVGAVTTVPFSLLTHGLRVVRGEISAQEAVTATLKDTVMGGAVGGVTAFTTATFAYAIQAFKSSRVRSGKSSRISASVISEARYSSTS